MLYSLYQDIVSKLKEELHGSGLTDDNFGTGDPDGTYPFISIEGQRFNLKNPQFKKTSNKVKQQSMVTKLTVPSKRTLKKGPYTLNSPPVGDVLVQVIKKPGTSSESVEELNLDEYTIEGNILHVTASYTGGTKLVVSSQALAESYADRFEQEFVIRIHEKDLVQLEQLTVLTIPAIWAHLQELAAGSYSFASGAVQAQLDLGELNFRGQSIETDEVSVSTLSFTASGIATFAKAKTDGFHIIEEVVLGDNEEPVPDGQGGIAVG